MNGRMWKIVAISGVVCAALGMVAGAQLGSIVKGGVVVVAVDKFGKDIDEAINKVTGQQNAGTSQATKVVPILSVGDSGYIGAVQVAGPRRLVDKVRGVAQIEGRFKLPIVSGIRLRALVPISTKTPAQGIKRVNGVGVSAIVDFKL
jgi:hypothetical protein